MAKVIVIVEQLSDWNSYYPVEQLMTPQDYLVNWDENLYGSQGGNERIKIVNLCHHSQYLSDGYYCSLLAEARGHSVIPSVTTMNDLSSPNLFQLQTEELDLDRMLKDFPQASFTRSFFFGLSEQPELSPIAKLLFEHFSIPILEVKFSWDKKWKIESLELRALSSLSPAEEDLFGGALDQYSHQVWRKPKNKKKFRYDLAILHDPLEELPPSNKRALQQFVRAGRELNVSVDLIGKKDYRRLAEYDALFLRETTALNHHTFQFAKKGETEGLVVMDDSLSILRCTNKIYMHNLLHAQHIPAPKSMVISQLPEQLTEAEATIHYPMIVKIPDGSFSKGIYKVESPKEFRRVTDVLFKETSLLLVQEYFYTEYDWRIGVLNGRPLFACKYYMTKGHWQIYDHTKRKKRGILSGDHETLPLAQVPKHVLQTAVKISHLVGDSLYGVDLKERDGRAFVVEINDNPNIDTNVEDAVAGMDLYHNIVHEFVRRIEESR